MKKKLLFFLFIGFISMNLFAQFYGGEGTAFSPYGIVTPQHLANIMMQDDDGNYLYLNCYFEQSGDIDLSGPEWSAGEGWEPIGTPEHPFTGNYFAYSGKIQNLTINRPLEDNVGLFGYVQEACLYGIDLENVNVTGRDNVGAIVGYSLASSVNKKGIGPSWPPPKSTASGIVNGNNNVGGLIGYAKYSQATGCYSFCDVSGSDYIGGLFGMNEIGIYTESEDFYINSGVYVPGSIDRSYSTGEISGSGDMIGGFVGKNSEAKILLCYSTSDVTTEGIYIGGLVGLNTDGGEIENCYSFDSTITGSDDTAGLVGFNLASTITNCYTKTTVLGAGSNVQGLVGSDTGTITNSYWDMDISGIAEPGNGEGRSTADMTSPYAVNTFIDWDFENKIWREDEDLGDGFYKDGYPYLYWEHRVFLHDFAGGSGTEEDPYLVATTYQLNNVRDELDKHFLQIRNIDLDEFPFNEGNGWEPIGDDVDTFSGNYDGNGFSILNLFIDRLSNDYVGLFGTADGAVLQNITLQNIDITGNSSVGGLVGHNSGSSVTNCSVNGNITAESWSCGGLIGHNINSIVTGCNSAVVISGSNYVGGLIGNNENSTVEFCYSSGSVSDGDQSVGGLVGMNQNGSHINSCYSTVDVTALGSQNVGGLVGGNWQNAHIANSYAKGFVFTNSTYSGGFIGGNSTGCTVTNCFSIGEMTTLSASMGFLGQGSGTDSGCYWNTETSGHSLSGGTAEGRTTDEMTSLYAENTYLGWDFTTIWVDDTDYTINNGYPYLQGITYVETEISEPIAGDILVNEICGVDVYPENDFNGYIELLNVRAYSISLNNVQLLYYDNGSSEPTGTLSLSGSVEANEYIVIAQDDAMFFETHGNPPADFVVDRDAFGNSTFPLDGDDDVIEIVYTNSRSITLDRFNNLSSPWLWNSDQTYRRIYSADGGIITNWGPGDGIPGEDDYTVLSIPNNMQITFSGNDVNLTWQSVMGATSYKIYSANNPQALFPGDWLLEASGIETTSWTDLAPEENMKFYRVVAVKQRGK